MNPQYRSLERMFQRLAAKHVGQLAAGTLCVVFVEREIGKMYEDEIHLRWEMPQQTHLQVGLIDDYRNLELKLCGAVSYEWGRLGRTPEGIACTLLKLREAREYLTAHGCKLSYQTANSFKEEAGIGKEKGELRVEHLHLRYLHKMPYQEGDAERLVDLAASCATAMDVTKEYAINLDVWNKEDH